MRILIIDDEKEVIDLLSLYLEKEGFSVTGAFDGKSGLEKLSKATYDCILLDVMLPKINGFQVLKKIRKVSSVPVIMISARVTSADKILGLDLGGDDYITKPFDPLEVVARVKTNIRRYNNNYSDKKSNEKNKAIISTGPYKLDVEKCLLFVNENPVELTSTEYQLLKLFISNPNRVFTK